MKIRLAGSMLSGSMLAGYMLLGCVLAAMPIAAAQTDVGLSAYGAFHDIGRTTIDGSGDEYTHPSNSLGGMLEFRHIHSPYVGFEATYSLNRANQHYIEEIFPFGPGSGIFSLSAFSQEIGGDWIFTDHLRKSVQIFFLVGAGVQVTVPTGNPSYTQSYTQSSATAAYLYGVGGDWQLRRHLGLRVQYRGDVHKAPQIDKELNPADAYIHTAEPMVGLYYRF